MQKRFWQDQPDAPYATLLGIIEAHCHPEMDEDAYPDLQRVAQQPDVPRMNIFKRELREVIIDPSVIPPGSLEAASEYDDGSDEKFLARLWRDLYPDEPLPTA